MKLVYVVCEGQTEETFVRDVLWEPFSSVGVNLVGQTIETSVGKKGGALSYQRVKRHLRNQLRRKGEFFVTTLFDLYRLDSDFPGLAEAKKQNGLGRRLSVLNAAIHADVVAAAECRPERFFSYIQPYEFEALLFSDVPVLTHSEPAWVPAAPVLQSVRDGAESPEHINELPGKNPAAHLERELKNPRYKKTLHGPTITGRIGLAKIEAECAFLAAWLRQLRTLG
jgi:hypothetical protein